MSSYLLEHPEAVVVTDPVVSQLIEPAPGNDQPDWIIIESTEQDHLDGVVTAAPWRAGSSDAGSTPTLLGIGGGSVVDATKYLAQQSGLTYSLAPTTASSNAPFTGSSAIRRDGASFGVPITRGPSQLLFDLPLILGAPEHLNRSGVGDVLALRSIRCDSRIAADAGAGWSQEVDGRLAQIVDDLARSAPDLPELVRALLAAMADHALVMSHHPEMALGAGAEHLFAWTLDQVTGKAVLHGGAVALGTVLMARVQQRDPEEDIELIRRLRVPAHPATLGVSWDMVHTALLSMADYNHRHRGLRTWLDQQTVDTDFATRLVDETKSLFGPPR